MDTTDESISSDEANKHLSSPDYQKWREIQRKQLGDIANLHFVFAGATLGFTIALLLKENTTFRFFEVLLMGTGIILLLISICYYIMFNHNRLMDYRATTMSFAQGKSHLETLIDKDSIGVKTWEYYDYQRRFYYIGFVLILIGMFVFAYHNIHIICSC